MSASTGNRKRPAERRAVSSVFESSGTSPPSGAVSASSSDGSRTMLSSAAATSQTATIGRASPCAASVPRMTTLVRVEIFDEITERLAEFIRRQPVFFVASAPLDGDGHVNVSPKGLDTLRLLGPDRLVYLDLSGSGAETAAHLRENGRICVMFCAFDGPAQILRLHGRGEVFEVGAPEFDEYYPLFLPRDHARAVVTVDVERISTSCGYAVPLMDFRAERAVLDKYWDRKADELLDYRAEHNSSSIDGLPSLVRPPARPGAAERAVRSS